MNVQTNKIRSILVVDDDRDDFDLVSEAIQEIDPEISVVYAATCKQAVQYRHRDLDFVLLDINMPNADGFQWLKAIRDLGYTHLPVIMYTNSLSPAHIARSYEEGANLFFAKPDRFSDLIKGLKKLLQLDWANPISITAGYKKEGAYGIFTF